MPKNNTEKDTKGKNKKSVSKKVETKKTDKKSSAKGNASTKKTPVKKTTNKSNATKSETVKVVETKKAEVKAPIATEKKIEKKEGKLKSWIIKESNNTPFVVAVCIIVILLAILIFTAVSKKVPKTTKGAEIVATVKGKTITADELYNELKESYGTNALINLIDEYIADKEVKITDDDKKYVEEVVNYYKDYAKYYNTDLATFLANYVGLSGISTEEEFSEYVLKDYKKTLAVQKFIGDKASEEDLKNYYKENYSDKITAKHILIEIDSDAEDKDAADKEAYEKAVSLINELNNTSADDLSSKFDELAKNNSDDTATYSNGGLIENFAKKDVEETFYNAANDLKDGEFTKEPVKTSYGYHIILKVSSTPVEKYKDIKDDVKKSYAESLLAGDSKLQISKWDELRKEYKLSIEDDFIKDLYKKTINDALNKNTDSSEE